VVPRLKQLSWNHVSELSSVGFIVHAVLRQRLIGELQKEGLPIEPDSCTPAR
jgi:hypothetical protein